MPSIEVDAQPTMDDNPSCQATTLDKGVIDLITRGFSDVKNVCGARQQTRIVIDSALCEYTCIKLRSCVCISGCCPNASR